MSHSVAYISRKLGECLLMSSLPGKALRMLVDIARIASDSTCVLKLSLVNLI